MTAGVCAALIAHWCQGLLHGTRASEAVLDAVAHATGPSHVRGWWQARLHPGRATGLALTIAAIAVIAGGFVLGVLAYLSRGNDALLSIDTSAAAWGDRHATEHSTWVLQRVTDLGDTGGVVILGTVVVLVELVRAPSRFLVPFLLAVTVGNWLITTGIKELADRARPTLNPIAETLGPSFPSGHSSTAAAFFAAAALVLGRRRSRNVRTLLAGAAVATAVTVAGTRVLMDLHWLSDVTAGLALGWAWFAVCAIAFGGRLLEFGAAVDEAAGEAVATAAEESRTGGAAARLPRTQST